VKATDALAGELWENKKERIRQASKWSSNPDWELRSMIVKSGDDCRQEHLAVQLVAHFYGKFSWCLGSSNCSASIMFWYSGCVTLVSISC
jgi:hypothetical protein